MSIPLNSRKIIYIVLLHLCFQTCIFTYIAVYIVFEPSIYVKIMTRIIYDTKASDRSDHDHYVTVVMTTKGRDYLSDCWECQLWGHVAHLLLGLGTCAIAHFEAYETERTTTVSFCCFHRFFKREWVMSGNSIVVLTESSGMDGTCSFASASAKHVLKIW